MGRGAGVRDVRRRRCLQGTLRTKARKARRSQGPLRVDHRVRRHARPHARDRARRHRRSLRDLLASGRPPQRRRPGGVRCSTRGDLRPRGRRPTGHRAGLAGELRAGALSARDAATGNLRQRGRPGDPGPCGTNGDDLPPTAPRSGRPAKPEDRTPDHWRDPGDHRGPSGTQRPDAGGHGDLPRQRRGPQSRLAGPAALRRCRHVHPRARLPLVRGAPRTRECGQLPDQAGR